MNRYLMFVSVFIVMSTLCISCYAIDPDALRGLNPDEMQQVIQNEQASDRLMYQMLLEKNRQDQYRAQNPFAGCLSMGEVTGKNIEEAKSLARQLGATNIQYLQTTATFVRAMAYKCANN